MASCSLPGLCPAVLAGSEKKLVLEHCKSFVVLMDVSFLLGKEIHVWLNQCASCLSMAAWLVVDIDQ